VRFRDQHPLPVDRLPRGHVRIGQVAAAVPKFTRLNLPSEVFDLNWSVEGLADHSLRQVVRAALAAR
jgi:hypothetical protein